MKGDAMRYIAVNWKHTLPNTPVWLHYELNAERQEQRKVEEYRNGILHFADARQGQGTTFLAWEVHPSLTEINADPQFAARETTRGEFERLWERATHRTPELAAGR